MSSFFFFGSSVYWSFRSNLGCTGSSGEPVQSPAPHLHPPSTTFLQPQRDCTVAHYRSNPIHPDTCAPTTPTHDRPLPADTAVDPAATLHGAEHAQPATVPLSSAQRCTVCPYCPSQPGGSSEPSQRNWQRPLNLSPQPHPAPLPGSNQRTGSSSSAGPTHGCRQSGCS